jgi:hypothetical protein
LLPRLSEAVIEEAKILDYLLSTDHPEGRSKAKFFLFFGFQRDAWSVLKGALLRHAESNEISEVKITPFGTKYVIDGQLSTPTAETPLVRCVWIVEGDKPPRLVTSHPL